MIGYYILFLYLSIAEKIYPPVPQYIYAAKTLSTLLATHALMGVLSLRNFFEATQKDAWPVAISGPLRYGHPHATLFFFSIQIVRRL